MANDRRSLLRRTLLKEQLAKEAGQPADQGIQQAAAAPVEDKSYPVEAGDPNEISKTQSATTGAIQGVTMGFSDELGGMKDVAGDVLSGNVPNDLLSKYREYQKAREEANKRDQEANPWSYTAGELGGGLASAALTPGLGAARVVGGAAKFSPALAKFLAAEGGGLAARMAGKGATMAIEGAPIGAAYGAGTSQHGIEDPLALAKDTAVGAGMGSLGGLAIGAGVEGGKALLHAGVEGAKKSDFPRKLAEQFKMGQKGLDPYTTEGAVLQQTLANKSIPNKFVNEIMATDKMLGEKVGASLDPNINPNAKLPINIDPEVQASIQRLGNMFNDNPVLLQTIDPKTKALLTRVSTSRMGNLTPLEARALKDSLYSLTDNLKGLSSDVAVIAGNEGRNISRALDQNIKKAIPEYADAAEKFHNFRQSIPETILQPGVPFDKRDVYLGNLKNKEGELLKSSKHLFGGASMPGASSEDMSAVGLKELQQRLRTLQRTNPEAVQSLGGSAEDVFGKWRQRSDQMGSIYQGQGIEPHQSLKRTVAGTVVGTGQGLGFNLANRAGQLSTAIGKVASGQTAPVKQASMLFNAGKDQLAKLSDMLVGQKSTSAIGQKLQDALRRNDDVGKNAALFTLMQNPEYRDLLRSQGYDSGESQP